MAFPSDSPSPFASRDPPLSGSSRGAGKKRIIVCCDGTACTTFKGDDKSPHTNVSRIARCIKPASRGGIPQVVHYVPGIGSGDESDWNPLRPYIRGVGRGIDDRILDAYSFICHNYNTPEDEIVLIGFSRGGFIIRCLADLVYRVGVLTKFGLYYVRQVYTMWRETGKQGDKKIEDTFGRPPPPPAGSGRLCCPSDIWDEDDDEDDDENDEYVVAVDEDKYWTDTDGNSVPDHPSSAPSTPATQATSTAPCPTTPTTPATSLAPSPTRKRPPEQEEDKKEGYHGSSFRPGLHGEPPSTTLASSIEPPQGRERCWLRRGGLIDRLSNLGSSSKSFKKRREEKLAEAIRNCDKNFIRRGVRIEVCAAWDTVASLGPVTRHLFIFKPQQHKKLGFIQSELSPNINNAFQALSLHDRRRSFLPIVWRRPAAKPGEGAADAPIQRLQQCWFMGYHGDVGGGRKGEGLAQFALVWMLANLRCFVDMDLTNFWSPHPDESNWHKRFGRKVGKKDPQLNLQDTFNPRFWLGGSESRKPNRQFWVNRRPVKPSLDERKAHLSGEFMHFTVKVLLDLHLMEPSKVLRRATSPGDFGEAWRLPEQTLRPWQWLNMGKRKADGFYDVDQALPGRKDITRDDLVREIALLIEWCGAEIATFQSPDPAEDSQDKRFLDKLKAALRKVQQFFTLRDEDAQYSLAKLQVELQNILALVLAAK